MARIGDNIYKRKDGRWEGRYISGVRENGKSKYRSVYGRSYDEVKRKLEVYKADTTGYAHKKGLTVNSLFEEWIFTVVNRAKESTIANYRMKFEKHLKPYFGDCPCEKVTALKVYEFIGLKIKSGLSIKYVSDIVVLLKSIFKYGGRTYNIYNPLTGVRMPKCKPNEVRLLNGAEQKILENHISFNRNTTTLGIALSMYTGLRIGELCGLKWSDVDLKKSTLAVSRTVQRIQCDSGDSKTKLIVTEPKSASSQRVIPIPRCLLDMLKSFQANGSAYILSGTEKPIEPRTMQYRFGAVLKKANLPSVHFHALRHMFATNCIELGFDVKTLSELLGHSSVEITLNRYVHSSMQRKFELMSKLSFAS